MFTFDSIYADDSQQEDLFQVYHVEYAIYIVRDQPQEMLSYYTKCMSEFTALEEMYKQYKLISESVKQVYTDKIVVQFINSNNTFQPFEIESPVRYRFVIPKR